MPLAGIQGDLRTCLRATHRQTGPPIKTFGGDDLGINPILIARRLLLGCLSFMLFYRKRSRHRYPCLLGLLAPIWILLFLTRSGLPATPGQLLPKPGNAATESETPQTTKAPAPSAAPVPEPIPLSDVAKRLESSRRQIREVSERVQPPEVAEIVKENLSCRSKKRRI
jgi:hypothetical protein